MALPFRTLRATLLVPFVLLVIAVAAAVSWLSYLVNVRAVDEVSQHLLEDVATRIGQSTAQFVGSSEILLNAIAADDGVRGNESLDFTVVPPAVLSEVERRLWLATALLPNENSDVYFASDAGRFAGVRRISPDAVELRVRTQSHETCRVYRMYSPHQRGMLLREETFASHAQPWYKEAIAQRKTIWTPGVQTNGVALDEKIMTLARPLYRPDGGLRGVAATDMSLTRFEAAVRAQKLSEHGVAFVIDPRGVLIAAAGDGTKAASSGGASVAQKNASQSESALVRQAYAALMAARPSNAAPPGSVSPGVTLLPFESTMGAAALSTLNYHDKAGLDWRIVVAAPRSDHMAPVYRSMVENAAIGVFAVLVALLLGTWMFQRVADDVSRVSRAAERLALGQGPITRIPDRNDEIGAIASSVAAIQDALLFDKLTGALNRAAFVQQFETAASSLDEGERLAVIYIDLDRFKMVNDRYGHAVGDAVLAKSAERIRRRLRERDLFARYGGDEFVVMVSGNAAVNAVDALVDRLNERLSTGMSVGDLHLAIGASVGVAIYPDDGETLDDLLSKADARMYQEKRKTAELRSERY